MPISATSQLKITEPVSSGKCGKIISYKSEWAFRYQYLRRKPYGFRQATFHSLKPLKLVLYDLKSKFPSNFEIKYQQFNTTRGPID
jgi:hypothetical protein